jgi:hypothetical protein
VASTVTHPGVPGAIRYAIGDNWRTAGVVAELPEDAELGGAATGEFDELVDSRLLTTAPAPSSLNLANVSNPLKLDTEVNFFTLSPTPTYAKLSHTSSEELLRTSFRSF